MEYDIRYTTEKNIVTMTGAIDKVEQLRGVYFDWKEDSRHDLWVIAQEVQKVFPEIVTTGNDGYESVDYAKLTPVLIQAVKELKAENDSLKGRIEKLESQ